MVREGAKVREEDKKEEKKDFFDFLARDVVKLPAELEALATRVVDAMVEVHRHLGPGHPEKVYENSLYFEFDLRGIAYERQRPVAVFYKGKDVGDGYVDVLVEGKIVLELKAIEQLSPTHRAQLGSYLAALNLQLGFLANFNVALMKEGLRRVVRTKPTSS